MDTIWLTAIAGEDCPDLLQRFTDTIALFEGRLLDQQLAGMDGMISGLLRFQLPQVHSDCVWQHLEGVAGNRLRILSRQQQTPTMEQEPAITLDICAPFRPGLDLEIRLILESHGIATDDFNQQISGCQDQATRQLQIHLTAHATRPIHRQRLTSALTRLMPGLTLDLGVQGQPELGTAH